MAPPSEYAKKKQQTDEEFMRQYGALVDEPLAPHPAQLYYPDLPYPENTVWERNDRNTIWNSEWIEKLGQTSLILQKAGIVCQHLATKTEHTEPSVIRNQIDILLRAQLLADKVIEKILMLYPLPNENLYDIAVKSSASEHLVPKLILSDPTRIIIWLPKLPAKSRANNNYIFEIFKGFLYQHDLPHFSKWHCDFIHTFAKGDYTGMRDVDNYPYKPIIDNLTVAMRTKDSYDNFSYSAFNIFDDTIAPGCYLHICKRDEKVAELVIFAERIKLALSSK